MGDIKKTLKRMGRDYTEQQVISSRFWTARDFHYWKSLKELFPYEVAIEQFREHWRKLIEAGWSGALDAMGLKGKKIKDVQTLGRVVKKSYELFGCISEVVEDNKNRYVLELHFCPNPAYGPVGVPYEEKLNYYKATVENSRDGCVQIGVKMAGLEDRVEALQDKFRCFGDNVCRLIYQSKKRR
jgi:hypothetical protein